jgi:DNA-binding transcriptional MerR regulator
MMDTLYTIKQVSERTGLSIHTLRYYERIGVLYPVDRLDNGHRRYDETDLSRIDFVKKLRATGMTILDIRCYMELYLQGDKTIPERRAMLETHHRVVQEQLEALQETLDLIENKLTLYEQAEGNVCSE